MHQPGVTQVDFWSFDQTFPGIAGPWLDLSNHIEISQGIHIILDGFVVDPETVTKL